MQIFNFQLSFARFSRVVGNVAFEIGKTFLVGVAHYRHDQTALGPNRNANIVKVVLDKIFILDSSIKRWDGFKRFHRRLNEERHEPKLDAILFRKGVLRFRTQLLHRAHIAFVESGKDRSGVLRHDKLCRDFAAQRRHFLARKTAVRRQRLSRTGFLFDQLSRRCRFAPILRRRQYIPFGQASFLARSTHARGIDLFFCNNAADRGRENLGTAVVNFSMGS